MLAPNFTPFPDLYTQRLLLRRLTLKDAEELFFLRTDRTVMEFINKELATTIQDVKDFVMNRDKDIDANEAILWGITLQEAPATVIGTICLWQLQKEHHRAEIGYALHPQHWRKGLMKEAINIVLQYGFTMMKLHSIEAHINPGNIASAAILESTGFVREAYFKENFFYKGQFLDTAVYSRLA